MEILAPENIVVSTISDFVEDLRNLNLENVLIINFQATKSVDITFLQAFYVLKSYLENKKIKLELKNLSNDIEDIFRLAGFVKENQNLVGS